MFNFSRSAFPEDFVFGAATSSYQIEGHAYGGAGRTHWDDFAATPGNVVRCENGAIACDHYHRYESDLDLARDAGFDAYRFSLSWARVLPQGTGRVNEKGLAFYDRLLDAMLARKLKPFATLYHWELPSTLADQGGWRNPAIADWFADYAELIAQRFGDRLASTATINEPWCVSWLSHFLGQHAPGVRDIRAAARAMHHVLLAHGKATAAMRARGMTQLGLVVNQEFAEPADSTDNAQQAARLYDGIYNRWFLGGALLERYPDDVVAVLEPFLPQQWQDDLATIAAPVDWIGINYYTRKLIDHDSATTQTDLRECEGPLPKTTMGWEIYPEGLGFFLERIHNDYAQGLPLYVTENGMSADDSLRGGTVDDQQRIDFINRHISEVRRLLGKGIPLRGYFIWSLLDNYEWALGYDKRFGLVHVDRETLERTPKASWHACRNALARSG